MFITPLISVLLLVFRLLTKSSYTESRLQTGTCGLRSWRFTFRHSADVHPSVHFCGPVEEPPKHDLSIQ
ncbi:unnamed protein product [Pleuronectes platessa]|uniref:Secreted protein n=1 Tax=Pleuronectes platessa TaxID=8262 RepID=A0A9N7UM23_PLEPL|nr:unnamed protein product [Pleuronectes platessa]